MDEPRQTLRAWFAEALAPKVQRAAARGAISPRQAAELARQLEALFEAEKRRLRPAR